MARISVDTIREISAVAYLYTMVETLRIAAVNCPDPEKLPHILESTADRVLEHWHANPSAWANPDEFETIRANALAAWTQNRQDALFTPRLS